MAAMMLNTTFVAQAKWFHDDDSDKWYYENNNGNRIKDDVVQIGEDGKWYAFDQDGWMRTGWIDDLGGVNRFYAFPSQAGNLADDQWALIDGDWYRFKKISKQGDRIEGGLVEGDEVHKIHDQYYYFDNESKMVSNAIIDLGDAVFYANEDGSLSEHEWQHFEIDDSNPNATIKSVTKCTHKVDERCDCPWYYFRDVIDKNEYEGMLRASNDNNKDPNGIRIRPLGSDEKNRKSYAFDREGKMIFSDWRLVDDTAGEYYFQHSGERAEGKSLPINGYWYTFDNSGKVTEYAEIPNSSGGYVEEEIWSKATRSNAAPARAIDSITSPGNIEVGIGEKVELKFDVKLASDSNAKRQELTKDHDVWINASKKSHPKVEIKDNAYVVSFTAGIEANSKEDFCLWADGLKSDVVTVTTIPPKSEEIKKDEAKDIVDNILDKNNFKGSETAAVESLKAVYQAEDPDVKETVREQLLTEVLSSDKNNNNNLKALENGYKLANNINVADPSVSEEAGKKVGKVTVTGAGLNAKKTGDNVQLTVDVSEKTPELDKTYDNVVPFEITFTINGAAVEDELEIPVIISMQLPEGLDREKANENNTQLFNIHDDNRIKVNIKIKDGMVYFATDRFSTYVFAQDLTTTPTTPTTPDTPSGGGGGGRGNNVNSALTTNSGSNSGEWILDATGWWIRLKDGTYPVNTWMYLDYNGVYKWYRFDAAGYMSTGWFTDADGRKYYLNPVSDGTRGAMLTGWQFIDGFWYYFNPVSDGTQGALLVNTTTPDGYVVNANGQWIQ